MKAKKTTEVKSIFPMINSIKELENCDKRGTYSTLNFDMFEMLEFNRGEDNGIDPNKMREFETLFANGEYMPEDVQVVINKHRKIIDGTHKHELHRRHNFPVNFRFTQIPELNSDDPVILYEAVSRINAINSKWNSKAHFNTALKLKLPLALEIEKIQAEYNEIYCLDGRTLSSNRVYSLLAHDKARLESNMVTVKDYNNNDLMSRVETPEFKREMHFVCTLLQELQEWNKVYEETAKMTTFNMIRAAMPYVWDNMLNTEMFIDEIKNVEFPRRFKDTANTVKGCIAFTNRIQQKLIKKIK
jgi:hypothetical protein